MNQERELTAPVDLCLPNGRLNPAAVGWSRSPLHRGNLHGRWPRKKRWNYWAITTETHLFSATISHLDYAGLVFVYYADFISGQFRGFSHASQRGCFPVRLRSGPKTSLSMTRLICKGHFHNLEPRPTNQPSNQPTDW